MTDHPIPDGLLTRVYVRTGHGSEGQPIVPRFHVDAVLAALAEWADGALIDPNGWRRLDTTEIGDGWFEAGAALEPDFADPPQLRLYTLTERKPVDGPSPVDP